jgi:hypothetical protein
MVCHVLSLPSPSPLPSPSTTFYFYPHGLTTSVLEVSHSGDGEEIVFVATYSAKESNKDHLSKSSARQDVKFVALICLNATNLEVGLLPSDSPVPRGRLL